MSSDDVRRPSHTLSLADLPSLRFTPLRYRPHGIGFWSGHTPFAYDLIASFRPNTLVELGTHFGESYFSFCQSAVENDISCQAYAVDTWLGDVHTGDYADDVFAEVKAYNANHYAGFSTLLRMRFDEAVRRFSDESIDLLHIDGQHTYGAVRHDFDTWWPKVSRGGIILLHDSIPRDYGFGVWRLVDEIKNSFPTVTFPHSNGLTAVLKVGSREIGHVAEQLFYGSRASVDSLLRYYQSQAARLEYELEQRRRINPESDITSQIFWRATGMSFSESNSIRAYSTVGTDPYAVELPLVPDATVAEEIRIDLMQEPALLKLYSITLKDLVGNVVWSAQTTALATTVEECGLRGLPDEDGFVLLGNPPYSLILTGGCEIFRHIPKASSVSLYVRAITEQDLLSLLPQAQTAAAERKAQQKARFMLKERISESPMQFTLASAIGSPIAPEHLVRRSMQLYWRDSLHSFEERFSSSEAPTSARRQILHLPFDSSEPIAELRLDLSMEPGLLLLHSLTMMNHEGREIWSRRGLLRDLSTLTSYKIIIDEQSHTSEGLLMYLTGADPFLIIPDSELLSLNVRVGSLDVEFSFPSGDEVLIRPMMMLQALYEDRRGLYEDRRELREDRRRMEAEFAETVEGLRQSANDLERRLSCVLADLEAADQKLRHADEETLVLRSTLTAMENSRSWRATAVLRKFFAAGRKEVD